MLAQTTSVHGGRDSKDYRAGLPALRCATPSFFPQKYIMFLLSPKFCGDVVLGRPCVVHLTSQGSGASATASPFRPGCSAPLPGATPGRSRSEAPIALSVVQTAEVTPRSGRRNAGGGSAKVVPVSTTPWRSSSQPNRNATNADVDVDVVDVNGDQDDGCDRARRRASYGRSESARGGGVGGGGGGRMVSRPPEPKGPPPSNGGGRRSSAPSLRLTRGEGTCSET